MTKVSRIALVMALASAILALGGDRAALGQQPTERDKARAAKMEARAKAKKEKAAQGATDAKAVKPKKEKPPAPSHKSNAATGALVPLPANQPPVYAMDFSQVGYGRAPAGWVDLNPQRPDRVWMVDGNGFLRVVKKGFTALLAYGGAVAGGKPSGELADVIVTASFKKTEETETRFGLVARAQDAKNHYFACFSGNSLLEFFKVSNGEAKLLAFSPALLRYREGDVWQMKLAARGDIVSAVILDASGKEMARVDGRDSAFKSGRVGLHCTTFAAAKLLRIESIDEYNATQTAEQVAAANADTVPLEQKNYSIVRPVKDINAANTPFASLADAYDVIVAGAGTGGTAAAVQAARMGMKVLLLEETDWIGGQMACAAVPTMDEGGCHDQFPVRERGFYREFHESMLAYYYTLDKDPFNAYYSGPTLEQQEEGGYEPKMTRAVLYGLIDDARACGNGGKLDLSVRSKVTKVRKDGDVVTGVTVQVDDTASAHSKEIASKVLIDATEYGDVIPLTGARYRVGNVTSEKLDLAGAVQDHTWVGVFREYPKGIPDHLKIKSPPPGYQEYGKKWSQYDRWGEYATTKGRRNWRVYFAWRGMADTEGPLTGLRSERRHTQCGFNGGNDYPVTVATIENAEQRKRDEREGIYRTLSALYYFQVELGLNWSLAEDEGYDTPYNRRLMRERALRPDMEALAVHLPQQPYVRESRRIVGVKTIVAADLDRYANEKHFDTSVAMGDYFMDLHRTEETLEHDLDKPGYCRTDGPFQVRFEAFIPEKMDGFVPAEKNLSQSRIVSGATRMQPSTMLTGQAAGIIAALAVKQGVQPRQLDPRLVQAAQLDNGSTLIQRWYADVAWGTPIWRATQLLSLYKVMDRPGPINTDRAPLGSPTKWGVGQPLAATEMAKAVVRLAELKGAKASPPASSDAKTVTAAAMTEALRGVDARWAESATAATFADAKRVTAGEFALVAAKILLAK